MIQSRQVEAFRAVMLTGGMTAAARLVGVTQPAISRLIRDLEAEAGFPLFQRRAGSLAPTPQARSLMALVEQSFIGMARIRDHVAELRSGRGGPLRVGALPAMAAFLPRFVARFCQGRAHLDAYVDIMPSQAVREDVVGGKLDVGVTAAPFMPTALALTPLEDHALVAVPPGHRLAAQQSVTAEDLAGEDLVLLTKFSQGGRHPVELALQEGRRGRVIETPLSAVACALVAEGAGIAVVDPFGASEFDGRGVALRPFRPALVVGTAIVRSSERPLSPLAAEFHAAFTAHALAFLQRGPGGQGT